MTQWIPLWSQLRPIGNSALAKSALAVPILGYLILLSDKFVDWFALHTSLCSIGRCDALWRLQCLYFGGWTFAIAAGLYWFACPPEIKKHEDAVDFANVENDYAKSGRLERFQRLAIRYIHSANVPYDASQFARVYNIADRIRAEWRAILLVLYGAGSKLVIWPT